MTVPLSSTLNYLQVMFSYRIQGREETEEQYITCLNIKGYLWFQKLHQKSGLF